MTSEGSETKPIIGALGDLIEDIVVDLGEPIRYATDSDARIFRRRGGSAANVAVASVVAGGRGRFVGNVGADRLGEELLSQLCSAGVETLVERSGRSGTIVALIDHDGERSHLTDRASSADLVTVPAHWLDGLAVLHVPAYAFTSQPLASAAEAALLFAREQGTSTSIDASAVPVIEALGQAGFRELVARATPTVVFCNRSEAEALDLSGPLAGTDLTVVKDGSNDAVIYEKGSDPIRVPATRVDVVVDTNGAGDAFAAGFLLGLVGGRSRFECASLGHELGALSLAGRGSLQGAGEHSAVEHGVVEHGSNESGRVER